MDLYWIVNTFIESKSLFSIILMPPLSGCGTWLIDWCENIYRFFSFFKKKGNIRLTFILLVRFQDEHFLNWHNIDLLDYAYFLEEC